MSATWALLAMTVGGCGWFPGPRYPAPAPPLVDEQAKPLDLGCAVQEPGPQSADH